VISTVLDHDHADNTSGNREPLGSNTRRAGSTLVRHDRSTCAGRVGGTSTSSGSDSRAVAHALTTEPLGGSRDREGDGHGRHVKVLGHGDGVGVLHDGGRAVQGRDRGALGGVRGRHVGAGDGLGGCGAHGGGHGRRAGPGRGAGHVAVCVDAALGADGGVDAGHFGSVDVRYGGGDRVRRRGGVLGGRVGRDGRVAGGAGGGNGRAAGRRRGGRRSNRRRSGGGRSGGRSTAAGRRRAACDGAVLVLGVPLDETDDVLGSLGSVQLEVVGVRLDGVGTKTRCADKIVNVAVVLESRGVGGETSQAGGVAAAARLASTAGQSVVRLVGSVSRASEQGHGSNVAADTRGGLGKTSLAPVVGAGGIATVASQDVAHDASTLAVAAQHNGGLGALGVVSIDLLLREALAFCNRRAVVGVGSIVCDVLVVAALAGQIGTDGGDETGVTLVGVCGIESVSRRDRLLE